MKINTKNISGLLAVVALVGAGLWVNADIELTQPIEAAVAYVRGLIFTDNGLPDGTIKAILSADPSRKVSMDIRWSSYVGDQLLIGDYCNTTTYKDMPDFKVCIPGAIKIRDLILSGGEIKNGGDLTITIGNDLSFKGDYLLPLVVIDKANQGVVVDPTSPTVMRNGMYVAGPVYINWTSSVGCGPDTLGVVKKVGSYWQVCEIARDKDGNPTWWYSFKTIARWDGSWLPTTVPTSTSSSSSSSSPGGSSSYPPPPSSSSSPSLPGGGSTYPSLPGGGTSTAPIYGLPIFGPIFY